MPLRRGQRDLFRQRLRYLRAAAFTHVTLRDAVLFIDFCR